MSRVLGRNLCRIGARRLLNKALQMCKEHTGSLLRSITFIQIKQGESFGKGCHTVSSEPYYYDSSYQPVKRVSSIHINDAGKCVIANEICTDTEKEMGVFK